MRQYSGKRDAFIERRRRRRTSGVISVCKKLFRNVQLKTKKWKLWKAGVCQAMTEDVNGA
jgi:hypothetical protein